MAKTSKSSPALPGFNGSGWITVAEAVEQSKWSARSVRRHVEGSGRARMLGNVLHVWHEDFPAPDMSPPKRGGS